MLDDEAEDHSSPVVREIRRTRERELGQHVGGEENNLTRLQADERNDSMSGPPSVLCRLPSKQSPHPLEVTNRSEIGGGEARRH
jgi:hypothetical protein